MMIQELLPKIKELNKSEKVKLLQYLITEIAKDEEINNLKKDNDQIFWQKINEYSLAEIWDNEEDDIYHELLLK